MVYWFGLFLIEVILLYQYNHSSTEKAKKRILWCIIFCLVYFSGFRDGLGMDYSGYKELCERETFNFSAILFSEPLFRALQTFCYNTEFSAVLLFLVSAFLTCALSLYVYSRFENFAIAAFVFIFFSDIYLSSMNIVSQFAAGGVILFGYYPLMQNRTKKNYIIAIVAVFIGTMLHLSSIFMLLPILFSDKNINITLWVCLIIASYIIPIDLLFRIPIIGNIIDLLNYSDYKSYTSSGINKLSITNLYMHCMLLPFIVNIKRIRNKENANEYIFLLKMYSMYLIFNNMSTGSLTITYRLAVCFVLFIPLLFAKLPLIIDKKLSLILIVIPLLILITMRLSSGDKLVVPDRILPVESIIDNNYNPYQNPNE